jgi:hypothetical protein
MASSVSISDVSACACCQGMALLIKEKELLPARDFVAGFPKVRPVNDAGCSHESVVLGHSWTPRRN